MCNIRIFSDNPKHQRLVDVLSKANVPFYVDGNNNNESWFKRNAGVGRIYHETYGILKDWTEKYSDDVVAFVVADLGKDDWAEVDFCLTGNEDTRHTLAKFRVETQTVEIEEVEIVQRESYGFRTVFVKDRDTMMYEVCKPFTDLTYTTAVHNFSERGHLPFFSSLFTLPSWGLCSGDMDFLSQVWHHLEMEGEYNIDDIVKNEIAKCQEGNIEPRVYRNTIEKVLEGFEKRGFIGLHGRNNPNVKETHVKR